MSEMSGTLVYRLASREEWERAQARGRYEGAEIDRADGYIHLSSAAQVQETARLHYRGRENLLLIAVDADALGDALKWEASRGGDLFPHLYASLPVGAVRAVRPVLLDPEGVPVIGDMA